MLFEISIFCPKIQLWFHEKKCRIIFGWKTRENVVVLDFLAVDNFDFTRKITKKNLGEKLVKMFGFCQNWIFGQKFDFSNSVIHSLVYQPVVNPQRFPVQHIAESFCTIPLNDSLPAIQSDKVEHVLGQLSNGFVQANFAPIHNVDPVGLWIADLITHEATKAWK